MVIDVISGTEDHLHYKCQIQDYQNKDKLSVCRMLLLQRTPNWAARGPRVGHSCYRFTLASFHSVKLRGLPLSAVIVSLHYLPRYLR